MPSRYEGLIYGPFSEESTTANEVKRRVGMTNKTALRALMRLAQRRKGLRRKQPSGMGIFWRE
jgi:hypothetical protein